MRCLALDRPSKYNCLYYVIFFSEKEDLRIQNEKLRESSNTITEFPNRTKNMFLSGLAALGAMLAYALINGMFILPSVENNQSLDEEED